MSVKGAVNEGRSCLVPGLRDPGVMGTSWIGKTDIVSSTKPCFDACISTRWSCRMTCMFGVAARQITSKSDHHSGALFAVLKNSKSMRGLIHGRDRLVHRFFFGITPRCIP
jgi:hypothetical protein